MSEQVRIMFSEIAGSYDIGNDALSFGTHRIWKKYLVAKARVKPSDLVLDLATGTGDIAVLFAKKARLGKVIGTDFCKEMIDIASARKKNQLSNLSFQVADAMNIPFEQSKFDVCSISFGIRNVDNPTMVLAEMRRVIKPAGRALILEFGQPEGLFGVLYKFYSTYILPYLGGVLSGKPEAYKYLDKTAANFPCGDKFVALMRNAGFEKIISEPLFGGIAYLYIGEK